jgi:glycerophosphoryl diester phosphodiesterase
MYRFLILFLMLFLSCSEHKPEPIMEIQKSKKIVIAHRGASGYLPEHTLPAKAMAYAMGADYLEQDVVLSKDDVPIVIHDIHLETVTNVAKIFPKRKRIDGKFYVIDFTFNELKQLNVSERFNPETAETVFSNRFPVFTSTFKLHSLQEEIEFIQGLNKSTGKNIGIYPEIKDPEFHQKEGKDISEIVLKTLNDYGYKTKKDNCILQCFDVKELKRIRNEFKSELFLVQLTEFKTDEKLEEIATYADGIGPWIPQIIIGKDKNGKWKISNLVANAHKLNLIVHAYTFRADQLGDFNSFEDLLQVALYEVNVDGIFTDFPDKAIGFIDKKD